MGGALRAWHGYGHSYNNNHKNRHIITKSIINNKNHKKRPITTTTTTTTFTASNRVLIIVIGDTGGCVECPRQHARLAHQFFYRWRNPHQNRNMLI
jgi:ferredoxin-like protein FixX